MRKPKFGEGPKAIKEMGHRKYVGGLWDQIGKLQFNFLKSEGLEKDHTLLDIGCGCMRAGRYFIKYLNRCNYIGVDKEKAIIDAGINKELESLYFTKTPLFIVTDCFDFTEIAPFKIDYSIAQSLFTHLTLQNINDCLNNLRVIVEPGHKF